jgi:hypothetical protein
VIPSGTFRNRSQDQLIGVDSLNLACEGLLLGVGWRPSELNPPQNCDRTTLEMRGPSWRIQIRRFLMKREHIKHTYKVFKTIISLKIKLLLFSLKITRMRSRMRFKR